MDSSNPSENPTHPEPDQGRGNEQTSKPVIGPTEADQKKCANAATPSKQKKYPTKHFVRIANLVIQGLLLLVGLGYSWFAWKQWTVMNQQLQMSHLDQRAWVAPFAIEGKPEEGKPYNVSVIIKNTGKLSLLKLGLWLPLNATSCPTQFQTLMSNWISSSKLSAHE